MEIIIIKTIIITSAFVLFMRIPVIYKDFEISSSQNSTR